MDNVCNISQYANFKIANSTCQDVVDYLFDNSPLLWKLLYYNTYNGKPHEQSDLTNEQKASMIIGDPNELNATVDKNILFQMELDEAISIAVPQVRFFLGDICATNGKNGYLELNIQIIVPNKQATFIAPYSARADRAVAILQELTRVLNGTIVPDTKMQSELFMNKAAPYGAGRSTGWYRQKQNTNYAGYVGVFSNLIV